MNNETNTALASWHSRAVFSRIAHFGSLIGTALIVLGSHLFNPAISDEQSAKARAMHAFIPVITITTQLDEVRRGSVDGRDFLTLHIGGQEVGPRSCRANTLRMDSGSTISPERQAAIETIALAAMLEGRVVKVVIPLSSEQCVDGMPTFTDLEVVTPFH